MNRFGRALLDGVLLWLVWFATTACAAESVSHPRIGFLIPEAIVDRWSSQFPKVLEELGYVAGKNVQLEWRSFEATVAQARVPADALVRANVDIIFAVTTPAAKAAMDATSNIPVIFLSGDPVAVGLAQSLARPGKNGTGISMLAPELSAKRLDYLKLLVPRAKTVGYLRNPSNPITSRVFPGVEKAAEQLNLKLDVVDVSHASELEAAMAGLRRKKLDAMLVSEDLMFVSRKAMTLITKNMLSDKLPTMYPFSYYHDHGGLISYMPELALIYRRLASYIDRILKGAKPGDLAVEQISKYELTIDLRVADAMKLKVPQEILLRADKVLQ